VNARKPLGSSPPGRPPHVSSLSMRAGRPVVFLSHSDRFIDAVARPIKAALGDAGIDAIIASDEPLPQGADWDPEAKIERFLSQSDCVVALATPDKTRGGGEFETTGNLPDEIARSRSRPNLRERILVFKEPTVRLHSLINPTHVPLDTADPTAIVPTIIEQMRLWDILAPRRPDGTVPVAPPEPAEHALDAALTGLRLGDQDEADRRANLLSITLRPAALHALANALLQRIIAAAEDDNILFPAMSLYEALARTDSTLLTTDVLTRLAESPSFSKRSSAAQLLWDLALTAPGDVPLGLLGRLARPTAEDWYVQAPAMAAAKELLLVRPQTRWLFVRLATSDVADDRLAASLALLDVASVDSAVVPRDLATTLADDRDEEVARRGQELVRALHTPNEPNPRVRHFGI
jgi:hypothetical protein